MKKQLLSYICCCFTIISVGQIKESQAIDNIFSEWNKANTPGCALGIFKDGKLMYAKGYGMANMEYNIPNSASSIFRIASTSKQFTAACIILLAEKGKLKLDDNLQSFFPDFPEYAKKITIRHLLNHTSGIRDYLQLAYLKGLRDNDFYNDDDLMKWLIHQSDLNFNPGEEHLYSNSGYWLLGQIVNKVAEMNLADFAEKEIFKPLGMHNTHFHNDHTKIVKNRASGYVPSGNDNYVISMTNLNMIGDGGIFTSIEDIKKWDDAFYNSSVLSKAFWKEMTQQGILNNGEVIDYASGLIIDKYKGLKTISHGGAFVGFRAELLRFPEERLSIVIFANRGDANPTSKVYEVAEVLLKDKLVEKVEKKKKSVVEKPAQEFELKQLIGEYEIRPGLTISLTIKNDSLNVLQSWNKSTYNIVKTTGNTYQIPEEDELSFTFSNLKDNLTQTITVLQGDTETKVERKKKIDVSKVNLQDYIGSFYSKELDVTYNFKIENDVLKLSVKDAIKDCNLTNIDQFSVELGLIKFQRKNGQITGFKLDSGRVKNLKFRKKN